MNDLLAPLAFLPTGLKQRISGPTGRGPAPSQPLGNLRKGGGARLHRKEAGVLFVRKIKGTKHATQTADGPLGEKGHNLLFHAKPPQAYDLKQAY